MKLINIKIFCLSFLILSSLFLNIESSQPGKEAKKFLFMYKYPYVKNEKENKLNIFTYKNVLLTNEEIVYFESLNEADPDADEKYDTTKYIFTMRYEFLDLPCLNRSFLCTHSQFLKEYKPLYPELSYDVPREVLEKFGDPNLASSQCLLLLLNPVMSVNEAAWLCHSDLKTILDMQLKLSKIIYNSNEKTYEFVGEYINNKNKIVQGMMILKHDRFIFNDMNKKMVLSSNWKDVEPYASTLYLKEELEWQGSGTKPDVQRCLKFYRKSEIANKNPDVFCAYYHRNDVTRKLLMQLPQGRFAAEMYTNKINIRLHKATVDAALQAIAKLNQKSLEVDAKLLFPIKMEVRRDYFLDRHKAVVGIKLGDIKKTDLDNILKKIKEKTIEKVCGGVDLCIKAIGFCISKEILPLKGIREKFAMDPQNPYHSLMPKVNIKIDLLKDGSVGKSIMNAIAKVKGANNFFAEKIKESPAGQVPNSTALKKAFNTILSLRDKKTYKSFSELSKGCKSNDRNSSNDIRRKISFLMYAGDNDVYFEYLGFIRDFQLTKK